MKNFVSILFLLVFTGSGFAFSEDRNTQDKMGSAPEPSSEAQEPQAEEAKSTSDSDEDEEREAHEGNR